MGGELPVPPVTKPVTFTRTLDLAAEAGAEVRRLEETRRYLERSPPRGETERTATVACRLRRRTSQLRRGFVAVFAVTLADADGRALHSELVAVHVDMVIGPGAPHPSRRVLLEAARRWSLDPDHELHKQVWRVVEQAQARAATLFHNAGDELIQREQALGRVLPSAATEMVQAGLFDRRALAAGARARAVRGALLDAVDARVRARERARSLRPVVRLFGVVAAAGPH